MPAYILTDDTGAELAAVECAAASMLSVVYPPQFWFEVPAPVSENTVALVDGVHTAVPRVRSDAKLLELAKSNKKALLKAARDRAEFGPFMWDGSPFDADMVARSRIQGAVTLAQLALSTGQPYSVEWTLANNTTRTLSAVEMLGVAQALGAHVNTAHTTGRSLRGQLDAATTIAEVNAISWT